MQEKLIRLTLLPAALRAEGFDTPPYRKLYQMALDGKIPVVLQNNINYVVEDRTAEIGARLGLPRLVTHQVSA